MAKGQRVQVGRVCIECGTRTGVTQRNKINTQEALKLRKYCNTCRKHTEHKESKKLH